MGRKGITYEQFQAAVDALEAERAGSATLSAIRAKLGTGSLTTIHRMLQEWEDEHRPKMSMPTISIPEEVTRALSNWVVQASTGSRAESEERSVQAQAAADELARAGEELEAERDQLLADIATLTTQRDQEQATASERAAEIQRLLVDADRERALAGAAQVEAAKALLLTESQAREVAKLERRVETLTTAGKDERDARVTAERDAAVVATKLAGVTGELGAAREQIVALQQELVLSRDQADEARRAFDARAQQDQARVDLVRKEYEARLDEQRRLLDQVRAQLAAATVEKAQLQGQLAALTVPAKE